jgi:hypothetical protein
MMFPKMMKKMAMRMLPEFYSRRAGWWGPTLVVGGPWLLKLEASLAPAGTPTQNPKCLSGPMYPPPFPLDPSSR